MIFFVECRCFCFIGSIRWTYERRSKSNLFPHSFVERKRSTIAVIQTIFQKNIDFCRRRQNKLKLLRLKNQWYMMIRQFISMKSICSCVFWWSQALKTIILTSCWRLTSKKNDNFENIQKYQNVLNSIMWKQTQIIVKVACAQLQG